jgi:hypothetical protein
MHADDKFLITGSTVSGLSPADIYQSQVDRKHKKLAISAGDGDEATVDIEWLPFASETYKVSEDPRKYLFIPIPIVTVAIPNRNLQAFSFEETTRFDSITGRQVYRTFVGKPTHINHQNRNPLIAKGAIFDATLQYVDMWDVWKISALAGFDITKDPELCDQIRRKKRTKYSMAALIDYFMCACCGHKESRRSGPCACMKNPGKGGLLGKKLVYQLCLGTNYIEISSVDDPADVTADAPDILWTQTE